MILPLFDSSEDNSSWKSFPKEYAKTLLEERLPEYQRSITSRFFEIRQRQANWDSRDSKKPNPTSVARAEGVVQDILYSATNEGYKWLTPFISSDEDGHITMQWRKGKHELHIEVAEDEVEYIKVWGANISNEMHVDSLTPHDYKTLWRWLLHG